MKVASDCPNRDQLQELIEGSLPTDEMNQFTEHMADCSGCQKLLQQAATGKLDIDQLVHEADHFKPPSDSKYWRAIENAQSEYAHSGTANTSTDIPQATPVSHSDRPRPLPEPKLSFLKPSDDPAYIGKLDRFEIARIIGHGGMGIVLEGFDTHLQRNVAIKVLNPEYQKNDVAKQRFCREARAAAAISHEHVVAMHQVAKETESEVAYLVMQLVDGETLEKRLASGDPLPPAEVARLGMQISAGLAAAHARGMIHRDIKPANILIERETERVKLTDFGLARATDDVKLTKTGMVTGTPLYMSPEQATGGISDERSDLFSLGAVLYEMATGISPFQAPSIVGVMRRIMDEMPDPPLRLNRAISKPLSDLIMSLLAKESDQRPESAAAVASALASIVTEYGPISPLQVPLVPAAEVRKVSGSHPAQSRWPISAWLAAVFGGICLMAASILWYTSRAGGTLESGTPFPSVALTGNPGPIWSVDFSPNGREVAAAVEDGSIRLWDLASEKLTKSFNAHRGVVWVVKFHPTRSLVASCGDDGFVKLWDSQNFELIREWQRLNAVRSISFSPDGKRLAAADINGSIIVYDIDSGRELATHSQPGSVFGIAYSPDGKFLATGGSDRVVRVWDAESFAERLTLPGHAGPIYNVCFASKGPLLATVGWGKEVRLWNIDTGRQEHQLLGSKGDVWGVAFCPDCTHLVAASLDGTARIWEITSGKIIATLQGHESAVHNVALAPAIRRIATSGRDGSIRIWDISSLHERR